MSEKLSQLVVRECKAENFLDCDLVFSGLDSDIAGDTGMSYYNNFSPAFCDNTD